MCNTCLVLLFMTITMCGLQFEVQTLNINLYKKHLPEKNTKIPKTILF